MPDVLILFASTHGHTEKIALRIRDVLQDDGLTADAHRAHSKVDTDPSDYDAVIVGASVHAGHHQREVVDWAASHSLAMNRMPSAFFSVSLSAAEDTEESREATRKAVDDFVDHTDWHPDKTVTFAGELQYLEYDFMTRLLMRLLMRRQHHPTDTSRDYDYTDWDAVESFAHSCAAMNAGAARRS
jgi:menaquinone-dependent protoporphyrinogen oxidase